MKKLKLFLLALGLLFFLVSVTNAAPAIEGSGVNTNISDSTVSTSVECGTNSHRVLLIGVTHQLSYAASVSSITVGGSGTGVTFLDSSEETGDHLMVETWYKIAPATGTNSVAVTLTGSVATVEVAAVCLSGAAQTSTFGTVTKNTTNPIDMTISGATGDLAIAMAAYYTGSPPGLTINHGTEITQTYQNNLTILSAYRASASSIQIDWSNGSGSAAWMGFNVAAASGGAPSTVRHRVTSN